MTFQAQAIDFGCVELKTTIEDQTEEKEKLELLIHRTQNQNREKEKLRARKKAGAVDKAKNSNANDNKKKAILCINRCVSVLSSHLFNIFLQYLYANCLFAEQKVYFVCVRC